MTGRLEVLIAGGGVAGLEAAFALHELAEEQTAITVLSRDAEFRYRPRAVREPFTAVASQSFALTDVLGDAGADLVLDAFRWLDAPNQTVHTRGGRALRYDALVLALGARTRPAFKHATAIAGARLTSHLRDLLAELESGSLRRLVAIIPTRSGWPLPLYELVLLVASAARGRDIELEVTVVSAEESPLAVFGSPATEAVEELLAAENIATHMSVSCEVPEPGVVSLRPGTTTLEADRVIALTQFFGPSTPGVPKRARGGFVATDPECRVRGLPNVYAAGDVTDFPIKFGAVAGLQADTAARTIARAAGVDIDPVPFSPIIHGALLGGRRPLYLSAHVIGHHTHNSTVSDVAPAVLEGNQTGSWLGPYLDAHHPAAAS
jgi:sulfide:quinone oxidoreductase